MLPNKLSVNSLVARSVSDKLAKYRGKPPRASPSSSEGPGNGHSNGLSQLESAALMQHMSLVLIHLRARIRFELGFSGVVFNPELSNSSFLDDARVVASMGSEEELLYLLEKLSVETLAGVVKLAFHVHNQPMLEARVCAEILKLFTAAAQDCDEVDVDDLRSVLLGLPGSKIDLLGQLMAILSVNSAQARQLSYSFGPAVFLPRYGIGQQAEEIASYERFGFDPIAWPQQAVQATRFMIENCDDIFGLDDEDTIQRLAQRLEDRQRPQSQASSYSTAREITASCSELFVPVPAPIDPSQACRANFSFKAKNAWELSVSKGELLEVLERGKDAWWEVRAKDGRIGLVPETFVLPPTDTDEDIEAQIEATVRDMQKLLRVKERKRKRRVEAAEAARDGENCAPNHQPLTATKTTTGNRRLEIGGREEAVD